MAGKKLSADVMIVRESSQAIITHFAAIRSVLAGPGQPVTPETMALVQTAMEATAIVARYGLAHKDPIPRPMARYVTATARPKTATAAKPTPKQKPGPKPKAKAKPKTSRKPVKKAVTNAG